VDPEKMKNQVNILLFLSSLFLSLILSEHLVRIFAPQDLSGSRFEFTDTGLYVNRSEGEVRHQKGNRVVNYVFHPPHLRGSPAAAGGIRILTVGDSFTFGSLLKEDDTYVARLQRFSDKSFGKGTYSFLNGAAGGWGASDYVAFVEEFGDDIKPAILLVVVNTDDIGRSIKRKLYSLKDNASAKLTREKLEKPAVKALLNSLPGYEFLLEHSHLLQLLRKAFYGQPTQIHPGNGGAAVENFFDGPQSMELKVRGAYSARLGQALFLRLHEWCKERNVALLVTTTGWHKERADSESEPTADFMRSADDFFRSRSIPFNDISSVTRGMVDESPQRYIIAGDWHPNELGAKIIAENIWSFFLEEQLGEYCRKEVVDCAIQ
jgi:hypothetical protein